jgi:nucleoside-diphosphate-sugar epimerase
VDVIVFGFHVPYPKWDPIALRAVAITADVAASVGATVLFPGNVYNLGPKFSAPISEDAARTPRTELGRIRERMEGILEAATDRGARVIVLRAGDYFGEGATNTWFELLTSRALGGGRILDPAPDGVPHAWAYLPDVARAGADLLERRAALAPFEIVHFAGHTVAFPRFLEAVRGALGDRERRVWRFPWWLVGVLGWVSPLLRLARTMRYLWDEPVVLDDRKLRRLLPDFVATPFDQAVALAVDDERRRSSSSAMRVRASEASARSS